MILAWNGACVRRPTRKCHLESRFIKYGTLPNEFLKGDCHWADWNWNRYWKTSRWNLLDEKEFFERMSEWPAPCRFTCIEYPRFGRDGYSLRYGSYSFANVIF